MVNLAATGWSEVSITLATGSDEVAPTYMKSYFEITETAEIAKAYAAR
jgi:hypothetical protein